ncbi:MAG: S41 family peptidase [Alphaproteobacteria bacterium]|nr:S41 family peptidase [Alphaproteobacteria bacterium]
MKMQVLRSTLTAGVTAMALMATPSFGQAADAKTYEVLNLFGDAFDRVRSAYVEEVADAALIGAAIKGMLAALDPLSRFYTPEQYAALQSQDLRTYDGLGLEVTMDGGVAMIIAAIDGGPGDRLGLMPGDLIVEINTTPVYGMTLDQTITDLIGTPGTMVDLTMVRPGTDPFLASMVRESVAVPQISFTTHETTAYIRVPFFTETTAADLGDAIAAIRQDLGDALQGIVLDIRNNPGGAVDQAVEVANLLMDGGDIVSARGKSDEDVQNWVADAGDILNGLPVVLLVNGGTAAASEIVAGAFKHSARAILLGENTFGKGSAQTIVPMGDFGFVQLTTSYYYTPDGVSINEAGIAPEILVEPSLVILQTRNFPRRTEADLRGALDVPEEGADEAEEEVAEVEDTGPDYQLARAFDLLHALALLNQQAAAN